MKIVLDTNVLVSGLLTPFGSSGKILSMICSGDLVMCLDARILSEYQEVLHRPKFAFDGENIAVLLGFFRQQGYFVSGLPLKRRLPDPDDEPFLEVAIAAKAIALVTGNQIHYPPSARQSIAVLSPSQFVKFFRKQMQM